MADGSKIEWTDATWNPVTGCSVTSPGCTNCYAMQLAGTRLRHHPSREGLTQQVNGNHVWTGDVRFNEQWLTDPLRWRRPRRIFVCAHGDLFHENVPDEWIDRVFAVMALCPAHIFQVLTKRPDRMREYFAETWQPAPAQIYEIPGMDLIHVPAATRPDDRWDQINLAMDDLTIDKLFEQDRFWTKEGSLIGRPVWPRQPLANVWLGVSVEDQQRADERIPDLLATPAAVRFLSCEPLLGPMDLRWIAEPDDHKDGVIDALLGCNWIDSSAVGRGEEFRPSRPGHQDRVIRRWVCSPEADILANRKLDWVIVGGESGPDARPMHPDWARSLRDQCQAAGVPFFFKQWGEWAPIDGPRVKGCFSRDWPAGERPKADMVMIAANGQTWPRGAIGAPSVYHAYLMAKIGKKRSGRLLDGREWSEFPA